MKKLWFVSALVGLAMITGAYTPAVSAQPLRQGDGERTILEIAAGDERFSTLTAAILAAGLDATLSGEGPFTVFAPTNDAFAKLPAGTVEALLADIPQLTEILLYHVVPGEFMAEDVVHEDELETASGKSIQVRVEDGKVFVDDAQVILTDITASNGVIHVIDTVLIPPQDNIMDIARGSEQFSMLTAALEKTGLDEALEGEGPFTVFAPTNVAAEKLSAKTMETLKDDEDALTDLLLYHVAEGKLTATDVVQMDEIPTLQGKSIDIKVDGDQVMADGALIVMTDIAAANGVIHVIDTVLLPNDVVETALADGRFTTLAAALDAAGLVETLQGEGPYTIFAPTDDAFERLPDGALEDLLNDEDALRQILLYHVVPGKVLAEDVVGLESADTAAGVMVEVNVSEDRVRINNARVIETDIEASNGVIHVINRVLLPPAE